MKLSKRSNIINIDTKDFPSPRLIKTEYALPVICINVPMDLTKSDYDLGIVTLMSKDGVRSCQLNTTLQQIVKTYNTVSHTVTSTLLISVANTFSEREDSLEFALCSNNNCDYNFTVDDLFDCSVSLFIESDVITCRYGYMQDPVCTDDCFMQVELDGIVN